MRRCSLWLAPRNGYARLRIIIIGDGRFRSTLRAARAQRVLDTSHLLLHAGDLDSQYDNLKGYQRAADHEYREHSVGIESQCHVVLSPDARDSTDNAGRESERTRSILRL
jgi:hypothetical protein